METSVTSAEEFMDGLRIVRQRPETVDAPRVIMVHGAMDTAASFNRMAACLPEYDVVAYDRRGYGGSPVSNNGPGLILEHVDDLLAIIGSRPSYIFGHSLGGVIALTAAEHSPAVVAGVMVYESPLPWEEWWPAPPLPERSTTDPLLVRPAAETFLRRAMGDERWENLPDEKREAFLGWGPIWATELADARFRGPVFTPENLSVPVLTCHGTDTDDRHRRGIRELSHRAGAPLKALEGGNHLAHRRFPAEMAALLRNFIAATEKVGAHAPAG
jgi:pimeloyl-ACP methyl ester carboxylesterase